MKPPGKGLPTRTVSFSLSVSVNTIEEYESWMALRVPSQEEKTALQALQDALLADEKALSAWLDVLAFYSVGHFFAKDLHEDDYASQDKALFEIVQTVLPSLAPKTRAYWEKRLRSPAWIQSDAGCALVLSFSLEVANSTPARPPWADENREEFDDFDDESPSPAPTPAKKAAPKAEKAATKPAKTKTTKAKPAKAKS